MTSLTLEEIVKWGLAIMVVSTVFYLIFIHFNPSASEMFWERINNATGFLKIGQEKLDYEFEMPSYMVDNVETINETIFILQDKNIPVGATTEDMIEHSLKLKDFQGCELTIRQDYNGKLKMMVKNAKGQIKYYKTKTPYSPCIISLNTENKPILLVDKITFLVNDKFKINNEEKDYKLVNLIKKGESICFGGKS